MGHQKAMDQTDLSCVEQAQQVLARGFSIDGCEKCSQILGVIFRGEGPTIVLTSTANPRGQILQIHYCDGNNGNILFWGKYDSLSISEINNYSHRHILSDTIYLK